MSDPRWCWVPRAVPRANREIHAVVRTSGGTNGTSLAPQGLLVGTVLRTIELAGSGGDALEIRPAVAVASLDFVAVLPRPPGG